MTGGLMKTTTSRLALAAVASFVTTGAFAADLGGNCCADLEERVSELEATTARKGNRKVSLTVYGQINKSLVWHDSDRFDAFQPKDVTIRDNDFSQSRFGFRGAANITGDLSVSYQLEVGLSENYGRVTGTESPTDTDSGASIKIRHNVVRFTSKQLGTVWVGQTSTASDGAFEVNLANVQGFSGPMDQGQGRQFFGAAYAGFLDPIDGTRRQSVGYTSPVFAGFTLSAAWYNKDQDGTITDTTRCQTNQATFNCATDTGFDVALRYAGEFNGVRLAAAVAYRQENDTNNAAGDDAKVWLGSGSIMHVPTGLFVSGGYSDKNADAADKDLQAWWGMGGIQRNWFGIGNTTLYGEWGKVDYGAGNDLLGSTLGVNANTRRDGDYWGLGITQSLDAAATDLYLGWRQYSIDARSSTSTGVDRGAEANMVMGGAIIRF